MIILASCGLNLISSASVPRARQLILIMNGDQQTQIAFRVAELFLKHSRSADDIASLINNEFSPNPPLKRVDVYSFVRLAVTKGIVKLIPPAHEVLQRQIEHRFDLDEGTVHVVPASVHNTEIVSIVAANRAYLLISGLMEKKKRSVGLGLGAGTATEEFCRALADELRAHPLPHPLKLIAISAGSSPMHPALAPSSFFHLFPKEMIEMSVGLFAEPLVRTRDFPELKQRPWIAPSFRAREHCDIIISSMGMVDDPCDKLRQFLEESGANVTELRQRGWIGNVQYRPFGAEGLIEESEEDFRCVTLFDLPCLKKFVETRDKHLLLIGRICRGCRMTKKKALLPLLRKEFRLFTELFIDIQTGRELVQDETEGVKN